MCVPSFAHTDDEVAPLVQDEMRMLGAGTMDLFFQMVVPHLCQGRPAPPKPGAGAWDRNTQPHPQTTRLSRFRPSALVRTSANTPLANLIYQARCELLDLRTSSPSRLHITPGATCMAFAGCGGWKGRDPVVRFLRLDETTYEFPDVHARLPRLGGLVSQLHLDEERKLVFAGDRDRVKAYSWEPEQKRERHTLDSGKYRGPLAMLPGGRIARAGTGGAAVWNVDALEAHGPGVQQIGGAYTVEDSWREAEKIELSAGGAPDATVAFAGAGAYEPGVWHVHGASGRVLCGEAHQHLRTRAGYTCLAVDLEHGGRVAARYLGHGEDIERISASEGDPNVFATACVDGFARLYDVRHPLPVMTIDSEQLLGSCMDAVFVHPGGVPTLFTAGSHTQRIKLHDVRARAVVYELATGNNSVESLAWDSRRSALWATTRCEYYDGGRHFDYRKARIPKWAERDYTPPEQDADDETEGGDVPESGKHCWPVKAFHGENFFGYCFDAGEDKLYRYGFKDEVDPQRIPRYGDASMGRRAWIW
ncbi:hypothetical protein CERSUDRAFT_159231 [Gelatoporia subvermispora B]|uniref:DUF2415 domain-containing protein n=1 Tax=Ceriporiopsis subvermispora (strain B) TaxID=914234 RepID=M2R6Q2_CERS8|nr:hypothetical protein CERSUDRAFT_159231 [Gelatoporia subvermispora B]